MTMTITAAELPVPFSARYGMGKWTASVRGEIVGTSASWESARRACLGDMGRTILIHDPIGRIAAIFRDGRDISED
jgi:hypothetical protein